MVSRPISLIAMASNKPVPRTRSTLRMMMTTMMVTMMMMRTTRMSSHSFHVAYPFWHLLTKGELGFDLIVIS